MLGTKYLSELVKPDMLAKSQAKKESKRQSEAREKLLARRAALLGKKTA